MKNVKLFLLSLFIISLMGSFSQNSVEGYTLTVNITDLNNDRGVVWVALYNSESGWMKTQSQFKGASSTISNKKAKVVFRGLPAGTYAVSSFHDENENKKLDTNVIGIPKEAYGFSNNPSAMFGPPSFAKAQFSLQNDKTITIEL